MVGKSPHWDANLQPRDMKSCALCPPGPPGLPHIIQNYVEEGCDMKECLLLNTYIFLLYNTCRFKTMLNTVM